MMLLCFDIPNVEYVNNTSVGTVSQTPTKGQTTSDTSCLLTAPYLRCLLPSMDQKKDTQYIGWRRAFMKKYYILGTRMIGDIQHILRLVATLSPSLTLICLRG